MIGLEGYVLAALTLVIGCLAGFLKAYTGGYGQKRGEIQAMHENIDKLLKQVETVGQRQEEIKAQVSNSVWQQQTQWTIKKEILFEALRGIGVLQGTLLDMTVIYSVCRDDGSKELPDEVRNRMREMRHETVRAFNQALQKVSASRALVAVVGSLDLAKLMGELQRAITRAALDCARTGEEPKEHELSQMTESVARVIVAMQAELGVTTS